MNSLPKIKESGPVSDLPRNNTTLLFLMAGDSRVTVKEMFNKFDESNQKKAGGWCSSKHNFGNNSQ